MLLQLATLEIGRLAQLVLADFLAIDLGRILPIAGGIEDGVEAGQCQQRDDDADDGFGNPPL
ncbi:hypothetical protein D3C79_1034050 [compost metagenome]